MLVKSIETLTDNLEVGVNVPKPTWPSLPFTNIAFWSLSDSTLKLVLTL